MPSSLKNTIPPKQNDNINENSPVDAFPPTRRTGVHDTFGNAWEWQEDKFSPLPGTFIIIMCARMGIDLRCVLSVVGSCTCVMG